MEDCIALIIMYMERSISHRHLEMGSSSALLHVNQQEQQPGDLECTNEKNTDNWRNVVTGQMTQTATMDLHEGTTAT